MGSFWLPRDERGVQQAPARTAPHLLDRVCALVERVARVADAGERPLRPVLALLRDHLPLSVRLGLGAGHHVQAMRANDATVLGARGKHGCMSVVTLLNACFPSECSRSVLSASLAAR